MAVPRPLKIALYYGNARSTDRNWRSMVWHPLRNSFLGKEEPPRDGPLFGVQSRAHLEAVLLEYRSTLARLIHQKRAPHPDVAELLTLVKEKAALQLRRLSIHNGLVVPEWDTATASFSELLYASLIMALQKVRFENIRMCADADCGRFFLEPSRRRTRYCSKRCRDRVMVRRYRERNPERYREYQRILMRRRYAGLRKGGRRERDE